jgi:hypothetical protein
MRRSSGSGSGSGGGTQASARSDAHVLPSIPSPIYNAAASHQGQAAQAQAGRPGSQGSGGFQYPIDMLSQQTPSQYGGVGGVGMMMPLQAAQQPGNEPGRGVLAQAFGLPSGGGDAEPQSSGRGPMRPMSASSSKRPGSAAARRPPSSGGSGTFSNGTTGSASLQPFSSSGGVGVAPSHHTTAITALQADGFLNSARRSAGAGSPDMDSVLASQSQPQSARVDQSGSPQRRSTSQFGSLVARSSSATSESKNNT